jgi:hypothetical protein
MLQVCGVSYAACYGAKRLFLPSIGPLKMLGNLSLSAPAFVVEGNNRSKWRNRKIYVRTCIVFLGNMIP